MLAGCWAHCFRKFEEAQPDHPEAGRALELIGKLYEIDDRAEGDRDRLAELRRKEAPAVLDVLKTWISEQATLKTLSIGKAVARHRPGLLAGVQPAGGSGAAVNRSASS